MMRGLVLVLAVLCTWTQVVQGAVTGSKVCNQGNSSYIVDTISPPSSRSIAKKDFGWMAIGFGSQMSNSPMVICWPNEDGSFTLSQRQAPSNVAPSVVSSPARVATLNTARTFANDTSTSFTFTLPSSSNATSSLNKTVLIWAYSKTNPDSSSTSATIVKHNVAGSFYMPLLAPWNNSSNSTSSNTADVGESSSSKVMLAHAVCGGLATLLILPTGILVPRIARAYSTDRWWFPVHGIINGVLGGLLVLIAYAIARANFHSHAGSDQSSHRDLGLAMFLFVLFQIALGCVVHWYKSPFYSLQTKSGRGPSNFLHMLAGVVIVVLGWATSWTGLAEEWPQWSSSGKINIGWKILWGLVVAATSAAYIAGLWYLLPKQRALERQARARHAGMYGTGGPLKFDNMNDGGQQGVEMKDSPGVAPAPTPGVSYMGGDGSGHGSERVVRWDSANVPPLEANRGEWNPQHASRQV